LPWGDVLSASSERDVPDAKPLGWTLSATGPVELLDEWMPESFAAVVNYLSDDRNGDLFRKNRTDIEADRHVHTLESGARNAFALKLRRNGLDFRPAA